MQPGSTHNGWPASFLTAKGPLRTVRQLNVCVALALPTCLFEPGHLTTRVLSRDAEHGFRKFGIPQHIAAAPYRFYTVLAATSEAELLP
jgi:hypothetical protein